MTQLRKLRPFEDRIAERVAEIDEGRLSYFQRDPDRPDSRFVKNNYARVSPEVRKAQQRLRTSRWRSELDRKRAPTVRDFGMALAVALATSSHRELTVADRKLVMRALHDLQDRGFDIEQAKATMRRLRVRMLDPSQRQGEASESCGAPIGMPGEPEPLF